MITVRQLRDILASYPDDYEVKWMDGSEIEHVGDSGNGGFEKNFIILADEVPYRQCKRCGCNVFKEKDGNIDYPFYCPYCDENMCEFETEYIEQQFYPIDILRKIWTDLEDVPIDSNDCLEQDFFLWNTGTDRQAIWHWFDEKCPHGIGKDIIDYKK